MALAYSLLLSVLVMCSARAESTVTFFKGLIKNPGKVGAFFPCSKASAQEICSYIDHTHGPLNILEIGSGTGALSTTIVEHLKEGDRLDMVELLPEFCQELNQMFSDKAHVNIFCGSILDWQPDYKYDVIICSIPFNRFDPKFVESVLNHVQTLGHKGTMFSYVELMWISTLKKLFLRGAKKQELKDTMALMKAFQKKFGVRTEKIYRNITPIYIHHLKFR